MCQLDLMKYDMNQYEKVIHRNEFIEKQYVNSKLSGRVQFCQSP